VSTARARFRPRGQAAERAFAHPTQLAPQGMQIVASSPEEMRDAMREDFKKWGDVIRETGTTVN